MKRQVRNILPFSGGKVLRFSGRSRSSAPPGSAEKQAREGDGEDELHRALGRIAANWSLIEIASGLVLMGLVGSRDEALARAVVAGQRVENVWETIESLLSTYGRRHRTGAGRVPDLADGAPTGTGGSGTRPSTAPGR